jgi:CheY-like chemotaxis protein
VIVKNVLVLDDHPANLHGIADVLRSEDYSVLEAATGLQAIETGRQCWKLSLLVSDIELPDLSGTEVALALYQFYPHLPILFMSGNAIADWRSQDRTNLRRFTADLVDFLEKPFSVSDLKMRVRGLVGRNRTIRSEWACLSQFI